MTLYTVPAREAHFEQIIEKSRFIAHVYHVGTKEEADGIFAAVRADFRDATHNVPAMVIGDRQQLQWGSDDGEPAGTSGAPMVQLIVREGLTNTLIVVTRYFGGIKLGTGGLVRAYTGVAKSALAAAGRHEVKEMLAQKLRLEYNLLGKLENMSSNMPFKLASVDYTDKAEVLIEYEACFEKEIETALSGLCCGKVPRVSLERVIR